MYESRSLDGGREKQKVALQMSKRVLQFQPIQLQLELALYNLCTRLAEPAIGAKLASNGRLAAVRFQIAPSICEGVRA